jgi:hypothetical protein
MTDSNLATFSNAFRFRFNWELILAIAVNFAIWGVVIAAAVS